MNANLFEQLGKYGGIGGISLGIFLLIVLSVIEASRKPLPASSIQLFRFALVLAWVIGLAGLFAWLSTSKDNKSVETKGGIAAGGNIVGSDLVVTSHPSPQFQNLSGKDIRSKTDSGVSAESGVAAGRNIVNSKISVQVQQGK